jgi:hypothetical protein
MVSEAQTQIDVLYLKNGSIIKGLVTEIITGQTVKIETPDGNIFVFKQDEVEKIVKETGTATTAASQAGSLSSPSSAHIVFYRPKKFEGSGAKIIIGSPQPDTVITLLKNGTYHEFATNDFRRWEFVSGIYKILPEVTAVNTEPGKKYYIRSSIAKGGLIINSQLGIVSESEALLEMKDLKVNK